VITNWGDRSTPKNRAIWHFNRCALMFVMQYQRLLLPKATASAADPRVRFDAFFAKSLDATLYAYALRNVVQMAELTRPANPGKIGRAIKDFERAVPDYENVRNVLAHFDAYEVGKGRLADVNEALADSVHFVEYDEATGVIRIGELELGVQQSYRALLPLLLAVQGVLYEWPQEP
jgi:hypothetical protein